MSGYLDANCGQSLSENASYKTTNQRCGDRDYCLAMNVTTKRSNSANVRIPTVKSLEDDTTITTKNSDAPEMSHVSQLADSIHTIYLYYAD